MTHTPDTPTPLSALLRRAREARGWTTRDLAARACCSAATIRRIESGRTRRLWGRTRAALAAILDLDPLALDATALADMADRMSPHTVCDHTDSPEA